MKALLFSGGKLSLVPDYPKPRRKRSEALIRLLVAGICGSDIQTIAGRMPYEGVLGHEFVGIVEKTSNPKLLGKRVVGEINCGCGKCPLCKAGLHRHCRSRAILGLWNRDGTFAEYFTLPEQNLHLVNKSISDDHAVFAEQLAAAYAIHDALSIKSSDRCLIMGDGKAGFLIAQILKPLCKVTLLGHNAAKVAAARALGIRAEVSGAFHEKDFDAVVEATGSRGGLEAAVDFVRPGGRIVLKTTVEGEVPVPLWRVILGEITIIGSRCGPLPSSLKALAEGSIKVEPLISGRFLLDDYEAAFAKARQHASVKVLLYPREIP